MLLARPGHGQRTSGFQLSAAATAGLVAWATPLTRLVVERAPGCRARIRETPGRLARGAGGHAADRPADVRAAVADRAGRQPRGGPARAARRWPPGRSRSSAGWLALAGAPVWLTGLLALPAQLLLAALDRRRAAGRLGPGRERDAAVPGERWPRPRRPALLLRSTASDAPRGRPHGQARRRKGTVAGREIAPAVAPAPRPVRPRLSGRPWPRQRFVVVAGRVGRRGPARRQRPRDRAGRRSGRRDPARGRPRRPDPGRRRTGRERPHGGAGPLRPVLGSAPRRDRPDPSSRRPRRPAWSPWWSGIESAARSSRAGRPRLRPIEPGRRPSRPTARGRSRSRPAADVAPRRRHARGPLAGRRHRRGRQAWIRTPRTTARPTTRRSCCSASTRGGGSC